MNGKGILWEIEPFLDAKNAAKHFQLSPKKGRAQSGVPKNIRYENRIFYFLHFLSGQIVAKLVPWNLFSRSSPPLPFSRLGYP
jgi:hypothetical protein